MNFVVACRGATTFFEDGDSQAGETSLLSEDSQSLLRSVQLIPFNFFQSHPPCSKSLAQSAMVSLITSSQMAESPLTASFAMSSRPKLVRKRSDDDIDSKMGSHSSPRSPSKKARRVSFDDKVEVRFLDSGEKPLEIVREEVKWALERHAKGDDMLYAQILELYIARPDAEDAPSVATLRNYTTALLSQVSRLHNSCSKLVHAVLRSQWLGRTETYVTLFSRFLGSLVSAQGGFLGDVLRMLVENLQYGR